MTRQASFGFLIAANLCWSTGGWLIKEIDLNSLALAGWRSLVAALFLLALRGFRLDWRVSRWTLLGACTFALNTVCFVSATKMTTAANAILLQYTAPVYVLLLSAWLLKEKIRRADVLATLGTLAGLVLLFLDQLEGGAIQGNLLALGAGISFAGTILMLRREAKADPLRVVILGNLLAALLLAPAWVGSPVPQGQWPFLLLLGAGQFGMGYACYAWGIRGVSAATAVLAAAIEPVLNPIWVAVFLHEIPGMIGMIGGGIVLASVTLRALQSTRKSTGIASAEPTSLP